jgi:hypothetical protein
MVLNGPMASLPHTLNHRKPLIGNTLRYTRSPTLRLNSLSMVNTALLPWRCDPQVLPHHTNLSHGFLQYVGSKNFLFSCLTTKQWGLAPTTYSISNGAIFNFLDDYCCRRVRRTVDSYPNSFHIVVHKLSAYPCGLIYSLGLSIFLRTIRRTEVQMGIQGFLQPFLELQNNLGFSIGHNPHGYSMETYYPRTIQLS